MSITVPTNVPQPMQATLKFYLSLPKVSCTAALYMCHNYGSVGECIASSVTTLQRKAKMAEWRAREVHAYLRRDFCAEMTPQK
ncbi:PREDICTED: Fanconi anemia group M protein-like [Priapulus caudatus]|uniref:Fanconi anemia group M protein-like n=1 Tax=Priapulus caudatus TaxID=37621 RepID=A0ABM1EWX7_PRICU|nr:PREDICTED: Fanconi anemia group M protein-like [Priapulus caudatus]